MRSFLALIFFALALWRAALDWMATVAVGEAWRFVSMEALWRVARGSVFKRWLKAKLMA